MFSGFDNIIYFIGGIILGNTIILIIVYFRNKYLNKNNDSKYANLYSVSCEGITDHQPQSFKEYILHNNTPILLEKLYKNLDADSISILDKALNKILHIPDTKYMKYFRIDIESYKNDFMTEKEHKSIILRKKMQPILDAKYKMEPMPAGNNVAILTQHYIRFSSQKLKDYIKNKIFIDGGANYGDTAIAMIDLEPSKIYSFEISKININRYIYNMKRNNIPKSLYEINKLALYGSKSTFKVSSTSINGGINDTLYKKDDIVKSIDLDSFLKDKEGSVGFIQADLQGVQCNALLGMKKTIYKYRPVLIIDISDNPEDFFCAKPLLEDIVKDSNYKIRIIDYDKFEIGILGLSIYAYPKELDE